MAIKTLKQLKSRLSRSAGSLNTLLDRLFEKIITIKEIINDGNNINGEMAEITLAIETELEDALKFSAVEFGKNAEQFEAIKKYVLAMLIGKTANVAEKEKQQPIVAAQNVPFAKMPLVGLLARCDQHFATLERGTVRSDAGRAKFYERYYKVKLNLLELGFQPTGIGQLMGILNYLTDDFINSKERTPFRERLDQDIFDEKSLCIYRDFREVTENHGRLTNVGMMDLHDFEILIMAKKRGILERNREKLYRLLNILEEEQSEMVVTQRGSFSMTQEEVDKLK